MAADVVPLAADFTPAGQDDWRALVERTLKGASPESLTSQAPGGLNIRPLYERARTRTMLAMPERSFERPWDIRSEVRQASIARAREAMLEALAGGVQSILLILQRPGVDGLAWTAAADLAASLDGMMLDVAPLALDAGFLGPDAADAISAAAKGSPAAPLAFHLDPIGAFARSGVSPGPIESHLIAAATTAARLASTHPRATFFLASGRVVHEAGGDAAQELAFALAAASAYAKAMWRAGMHSDASLRGLVLGLTADADPLVTISKLRAARMVWARFSGAFGGDGPARIEARSSMRMLTRAEPWTNMVRLTAAGAAAAIGGADAIVLGTFTDALGPPAEFARRMARNTQLILMDEGRLGAVSDPAAGSGAFEALGETLARSAWSRFTAIEAAGGLIAALRDQAIGAEVAAARAELAASLSSGDRRIVGVTDFRADPLRRVETEPSNAAVTTGPDGRLPGPDSHCPPLSPILLETLAA